MPGYADRDTWYGWQTIASDLVAVGLTTGSALSDARTAPALGLGGLGVYALGAPIVHTAHGHVARGGVDLGLRLGAPIAGLFAGFVTGLVIAFIAPPRRCGSDQCFWAYPLGGALIGGGAGVLTASAVDAAFFAWDGAPARAPAAARAPALRLAPTWAALPGGGATGGIAGTF